MISALIQAVKDKNTSLVKRLVSDNPTCINDTDMEGMTALMWASYFGEIEIVRALVSSAVMQHIDLNRTTLNTLMTPLHFSAKEGHTKTLELLLEYHEINPNCRNISGFTPLMFAASNGHIACVNALISKSDLSLKDNLKKWTAMDWAQNDEIKSLIDTQSATSTNRNMKM